MTTETESHNAPILRDGQILTGPQFNEPMLVVTVGPGVAGSWNVGLVGQKSQRFRQVRLTSEDISGLSIADPSLSYGGDGNLLRLGIQAYSLGIAYEFDPYFGLSISRVDPLPHQLEAVYEHLLKIPTVRFLLADDAGAGKTIMSGLLIRELKMRGLIDRILVVCPANLTFQWQRELNDKFDETFVVMRGSDLREQFGINQWMDRNQVITSLDLAKRDEILPSLRQAHWDLVIVDEAHRMSARDESHKSQRYRLGELLRDSTDHILMLTATPHKGDPRNFTLFLQLLDEDAYADVKSIEEAMEQRQAPFYLRRTKEAMVHFPERQLDGTWAARPVFTKRITNTAGFRIAGAELDLYEDITRFVKRQSRRAAAQGDDRRARAVGFLMSLYQRRLASSAYAIRRSLENRANRLAEGLAQARKIAAAEPPNIPDLEDLEELEDAERERLERRLEAITLAGNADEVNREIAEIRNLATQAQAVESSGKEAKLDHLRATLTEQGFFDNPDQRLLIFTEFKDTLEHLVQNLSTWGFRVGTIHGGMRLGSREDPGSRLHTEQQFRDGEIQILVATEAAGEGINLQSCHILFNYDIPWNPNRLEQRMGRIHRYGQQFDCLIFNFVASNTIEGRVLERLLYKLQEIRDALDDDAVFNVVGEVLPAVQVDRVFRDYYAGKMGDADLEDRLLQSVDESRFREICQHALEGLASKKLNLNMLIERRAMAQRRRVVPETIARFIAESAKNAALSLRPVARLPHTFVPGRTPFALKLYDSEPNWRLADIASNYPRFTTDRDTADENNLEWITPGHPLFEALRRYNLDASQDSFANGACFYSLEHDAPARLDFYCARVVDGMSKVIHERLFVVELQEGREPRLREPDILGNMTPAPIGSTDLPDIASLPEADDWLDTHALTPFIDDTCAERLEEIDRVKRHVEISLTEVLQRMDTQLGLAIDDVSQGVAGAEGRMTRASSRQSEALARRERRRREFTQQRALTIQGVERLTSALVLPHPDGDDPEVRSLRPNSETEMIAMQVVMEYEESQGRKVCDVHEGNLGYDVASVDMESGEQRLIEVKGLAAATGTILLSPNERRVAEDRRDCYWLYIVTNCTDAPILQEPVKDPAQFPWHEVSKVQRYWLQVDAMTQPMHIRERPAEYK